MNAAGDASRRLRKNGVFHRVLTRPVKRDQRVADSFMGSSGDDASDTTNGADCERAVADRFAGHRKAGSQKTLPRKRPTLKQGK